MLTAVVLVEIRAAASNFFDLLQMAGKYQNQPPFPFLLGAEFSGIVLSAPPSSKFKPGDRVVSSFFTSCGHCAYCRKGWFNQCVDKATFGFGEYYGDLGGGQSEYVVVPLADHSMEPSRRRGTPGDVNRLILYLLEGTDFATGGLYRVDGGRSLA